MTYILSCSITSQSPWRQSHKTFHVSTDRPDMLQIKNQRLSLRGHEKSQISMRYLCSAKQCQVRLMVFINDEEDKNEEAFAVMVTHSGKGGR